MTDPEDIKTGFVDRKTVARVVLRAEADGNLERHWLGMPAKTTGGLRQHEVYTLPGAMDLKMLEKVCKKLLRTSPKLHHSCFCPIQGVLLLFTAWYTWSAPRVDASQDEGHHPSLSPVS